VYFDTVQNQLQLGPAQGLLPGRVGLYPELALLQPFTPQAEAGRLEVQHLHLGAATVHKDKIMGTSKYPI